MKGLQDQGQQPPAGSTYVGNRIENHHTVLGNGRWGKSVIHTFPHFNAILWILNAVRNGNYRFVPAVDQMTGAVIGQNLIINNLSVNDVPELVKQSVRCVKYVFDFNHSNRANVSDATNSNIVCGIRFNVAIDEIRNNDGNDGAAGWCYVAG